MSKAIRLFTITVLLFCIFSNIRAQSGSIQIIVFQDLSSIDFAAFAFEKNLKNQPRILQVMINSTEPMVSLGGDISWQKPGQSSAQSIGNFRTNLFSAAEHSSIFNDELGNGDLALQSSSYNSDLMKDNLDIGKPSGVYFISLTLYNAQGSPIGSASQQFSFLNPTPPVIQLPTEGSSYDIGSIIVQWTESPGAASYEVLANYFEEGQSPEQALTAADPLVNNSNVQKMTSVNLRTILDRELLAGKNIVIAVKALVDRPGGQAELQSPLVTFKTNSTSGENTVSQTTVDPNVLQLADFLNGKVNQDFIESLRNGEIPVSQIQITDENNNPLTFSELLVILNDLTANDNSLISVSYNAQ